MNQLQVLSISTCSISYCSFEHSDTVFLFQFCTAEANEDSLGIGENFQSFQGC